MRKRQIIGVFTLQSALRDYFYSKNPYKIKQVEEVIQEYREELKEVLGEQFSRMMVALDIISRKAQVWMLVEELIALQRIFYNLDEVLDKLIEGVKE